MKRFAKLIALVVLISATFFVADVDAFPENIMSQQISGENDEFSFVQRNLIYKNQGHFYVRKVDSKASNQVYQTSFYVPGAAGTIKYFNANKEMVEEPLRDGLLPSEAVIHIQTDKYSMIIGQGYTYRDQGQGTIESVDSKPIKIKREQDKWLVTYTFTMEKDTFGILWGVGSQEQLVDLEDANQRRIWSVYDLDRSARLSFDGYHYKSPSSYVPYSENSYWRIPSSYITNSLVKTGGSPAAEIMGNALLIIAEESINEQGYIPTLPESAWLSADYKIGPGFFDTRFNADTIETYLVAYKKYGNPLFREAYLRMADYYLRHGENNHFSLYNMQGTEGWLVEDYSYNDDSYMQTHVSLNHQLQAIHVFLLLYEQEDDQNYLDFADKMLMGIKNTRDNWIMEDNNLEYAYLGQGEMGLTDYDYLTYNDLFNVQADLVRIRGSRDADLDILMAAKKSWMDAKGITDYRK
ncbi:MAG: hypothetical protein GXY50_05300 [Syntrophomonadaceae bacterium]|nr:hypothetical protein [Syntrophomonadaceae bacterium]